MSVRMELGSHWTDFHEIWYLCLNSVGKIKSFFKHIRMTGSLHEDQYTFLSHLAQFFLEWEMFQIKVVEQIKTYVLRSITFFPYSRAAYDIL